MKIKNYKIGNSIIENLASKIISIAKENSTEGNYIFYLDDIRKISKLNCSNKIFKDIEIALLNREEIADVQISSEEIDIMLWGEYI